MCGRFAQAQQIDALRVAFDLQHLLPVYPSFNISPGRIIAGVRATTPVLTDNNGPRPEPERELAPMLWGLVPMWSSDPMSGPRPFNARAETAAEKPTFRNAIKRRRCLIPAQGYYEWHKRERARQPYYFTLRSSALFGMAGLWERWNGADGSVLDSCTILTVAPNALAAAVHDRMPAIIAPGDYARWLAPFPMQPGTLADMLKPWPAEDMQSWPVSARVGNVAEDDAALIEPIEAGADDARTLPPAPEGATDQPELF